MHFSTKTQKERKGLGTSPFGPVGLTTVPIPCVSLVFLESAAQEIQEIQEIQDGGFAGRALAARSVLRSLFSGAAQPPHWVSDIFCPIESDTFYKALTLYWL